MRIKRGGPLGATFLRAKWEFARRKVEVCSGQSLSAGLGRVTACCGGYGAAAIDLDIGGGFSGG